MASVLETLRRSMPPPRLEECRRILCVQPHPDDTEIGAGATVAKLARLGAEITYLTVTDGGLGGPAEVRREEQAAAARILGVKELLWLGFPDAGDYGEDKVRREIIRIIRELRPDLVLTVDPWLPYEAHPDHLKTGRAASAAALLGHLPAPAGREANPGAGRSPIRGIAYYFTAAPNAFVEVGSEEWERKFAALACHRSQMDERAVAAYRMYFELKAAAFGAERAEGFKVLPREMMHCMAEAGEY